MNVLTYVKLGLVGLFVIIVAAFVLSGKLEATAGLAAITAGVGALVVALGIQGAGNVQAAARVEASKIVPEIAASVVKDGPK